MSDMPPAYAGLYGKVPAKADFVHRNLPSAFVRPWDAWISACLADSRAMLGGRWTELYLSGPVWRFAAQPGLLGPGGWAGVLATSVDAVNRFYPLTIAVPLGDSLSAGDVPRLDGSLSRLEDLALDAIEGVVDVDRAALQAQAIAHAVRGGGQAPCHVWLDASGVARGWLSMAPAIPEPPAGSSGDEADAVSYWWRAPWNGEPAAGLAFAGLPPAMSFAALLTGVWFEYGWQTPGSGAPS